MQVVDADGNIYGDDNLEINDANGKPKTTGGGGAAGYYAMYQDNITQTAAVINTGYPIKFRTLDYSNGVSVVSNSRITIANTGVYNLQFSVQLENSSTQEHDVTIWLRKNGVDVTGSSGFVSVASSHGGVHGHVLPAWNYLLDVIGGDYYELVWSVSDTAVTMPYYPGSLPPPSAASAIFTVTQQAGIIAGTGMTALNGLSGAVQTISTGTTGTDFNVVSSGTDHKFNIPTASATNRGALSTTDWSTFNSKQPTLVSGTNIKTINSTSLLGSGDIAISSGLTVGTTAIASGTIGRVLFQGTGNVLQQSAGLSFATANNQLNIGTSTYLRGGTSYLDSFANGWGLYNCGLQSTFYGNNKDIWNLNTLSIGFASASARLDVKAAGALSTDIAFRVRNSADTKNIFKIQGDANAALGELTDAGTKTFSVNTYNNPRFVLGTGYSTDTGVISITRRYFGTVTTFNDNTLLLSQNSFSDGNNIPYKHHYVNPSSYYGSNVPAHGYNAGFMYFKNSAVSVNLQMKLSPDNALNIYSSTALPIETNFVDAFQIYSADIVAGNSAPHFRTENGSIIKLYQQPTGGSASTFVTNTSLIANDTATFDGYTIGQVVKALRNMGILA